MSRHKFVQIACSTSTFVDYEYGEEKHTTRENLYALSIFGTVWFYDFETKRWIELEDSAL